MISQLKSIAHDSMCESACKIFRLDSTERPFPSFSSFEFDATIRIASSLAGLRGVFFAAELESRAVGIAPVSSHAFPAALVSVALSLSSSWRVSPSRRRRLPRRRGRIFSRASRATF